MPRRSTRGEPIATFHATGRAISIAESLGKIDLDNLREEVAETGSEAVWYGVLAAQTRRVANLAKLELEILQAQLGKETRQGMANRGLQAGRGEFTADGVRDLVTTDPRYRAAYEAYLTAEEHASIVESAKFAVVQKTKTLESLVPLLFPQQRIHDDLRDRSPAPHVPRTPVRTP